MHGLAAYRDEKLVGWFCVRLEFYGTGYTGVQHGAKRLLSVQFLRDMLRILQEHGEVWDRGDRGTSCTVSMDYGYLYLFVEIPLVLMHYIGDKLDKVLADEVQIMHSPRDQAHACILHHGILHRRLADDGTTVFYFPVRRGIRYMLPVLQNGLGGLQSNLSLMLCNVPALQTLGVLNNNGQR